MDPITTVIDALVAGVSSGLKDASNHLIKDSYENLKTLLIKYLKSDTNNQVTDNEAKVYFDNLEKDPERFKEPIIKKMKEITIEPNVELIEQAQQLQTILKTFHYEVNLGDNNKGVQIGNNNTQTNNFN